MISGGHCIGIAMGFDLLEIPAERHPTQHARAELSRQFGFVDIPDIQDWERFFADATRIAEFLGHYSTIDDQDEKFLLMELILASASDCEAEFFITKNWKIIERILVEYSDIHGWSTWYWACVDEESRIPYNDFIVSPYLQSVLFQTAGISASNDTIEENPAIQFGKFWGEHFRGCDPIAHRLRVQLKDKWVRFHSMPESKRYPDSNEDLRGAIERMLVLADQVLGAGSQCWMVANPYIKAPALQPNVIDEFSLYPCLEWVDTEEVLDGESLVSHAGVQIWTKDRFVSLLKRIAIGECEQIMWVSQQHYSVFAPYDGGVDLILPDEKTSTSIALKYSNWLSPFPGGM